ncbi:MAG: response regulator transcription factor [Candidatus Eremiobacteraeota bacterium]|nr:response regulator transcription factor [Candidatus Eremiobacteraeota bacterium]
MLVVDDEPQIRQVVRHVLEELGVTVYEAATGRAALDVAAARIPDLVVLDLGLPDMDGAALCRELRAWSAAPVLVLSARHSEQEKIRLLDAGADDYLTKPFGPGELAARVRAQLRRANMRVTGTTEPSPLHIEDLVVDFHRRVATRAGESLGLTPIEWGILRTLAAEPGRTLTHKQIFDKVWARQFGNAAQYLRVHVTNLRRKVERVPSSPELIVTEPGVGYRFEPPRDV